MSQRKDFKDAPLGSVRLNRLGLHPLRMAATDGLLSVRRGLLRLSRATDDAAADLKGFFREGVSVIHPFFATELFTPLQAEVQSWTRTMAQKHPMPENLSERGFGAKRPFEGGFDRFDGGTLNRFLEIGADHLPLTARATMDRRLAAITALASGFAHAPDRFSIYQTVQGDPENHDPQQDPHRDTFHSTVKLWLFLEDVPEEVGPFSYVPFSHRLTWQRRLWEYRRANEVAASNTNRKGGAFRVSLAELKQMGAQPIRSYPVKANTLVIADVRGFHCRSAGNVGGARLSLYANLRQWPFAPLPWNRPHFWR